MQRRRQSRISTAILMATALLASTFSGAASADVITEYGFFNDISDGEWYSSPGDLPMGFYFAEEAITGIGKFNPALGTLNSVTLYAEFEGYMEGTVLADDVIDDALSHSVDFDADTVPFFIGYEPGGGGSTWSLVNETYSAVGSCFGDPFDGPCYDTFGDGDVTTGSDVVSSLGGYLESDFVGVGDVAFLSAIVALPSDGLFVLDNVASGWAEILVDMNFIDLTVEYDYTPIPEPSSGLLVMAGLLGVAVVRRRA